MHEENGEVHIEKVEARAATNNGMRWILGASLLLAIIIMSVVWIVPALADDDNISDRNEVALEEQQDDGTDSLIVSDADELGD